MKLTDAMKQTHGIRVVIVGATVELAGTTITCNGYTEDIEEIATMHAAEIQARLDIEELEVVTIIRWVCNSYLHDVIGDF